MAKRQTKADGANRRCAYADMKKLWSAADPQRWYLLLRELAPDQGWTLRGKLIKGRCPFHADANPSFILDFGRQMGRCYGCDTFVGDIAQLVAALRHSSYAESLVFLNGRFDLTEVLGNKADELAAYNQLQQVKNRMAEAMRQVVAECIRDRPSHLTYLRPGLAYLTYGRGLPLTVLPRLPVGLFARPEHLKAHLPEADHARVDEYFAKYRHPRFQGAVAFWYNHAPDSISRFKLRMPAPDAPKILAAYPNPANMPADEARALYTKDFLFVDDPYAGELGLYGLNHYRRVLGAADADAYLTEGEFDALAVMAAQMSGNGPDMAMLAAGGKSGTDLACLRECGVRVTWVVQDHPARNGDSFAAALLRNPRNFTGDAAHRSLNFKIFRWPPEMRGGDLDEAVRDMGYEAVSRVLCGERASRFSNAAPWIVDRCAEAVDRIKAEAQSRLLSLDRDAPTAATEEANILDDQERDVRAVILEWFRCVHEPAERLAFARHFAAREHIDIAELDDVRQAIYALNTVEGAKARLRAALEEVLQFAYYEAGRQGNVFTLWSKRHCETVTLPLNDTGLEQMVSLYAGAAMLDWARSLLGKSPVLYAGCAGKDPLADERRLHANALFLLRQVVLGLSSECRQAGALTPVGQGVHYVDLPVGAGGSRCVYVVNGPHVFRGRFEGEAGGPVEWDHLNNVADGGLLFLLRPRPWSAVADPSDLYAASRVDLGATFKRVRDVLDCWRFKDHALMRDYLAAWILSLPVQRAVGQVGITFLTGESTSGKTSFIRLLGGNSPGSDVPAILEAGTFATDATPAWIYQEMNGSSLLLGLDEAETRFDTEHGARINEIQRMLYSLPTGGVSLARGGATPDQRLAYHLRMPVLMAAISMQTDPVFLTRIMVVRTRKEPGRRNVGDALADMLGQDELDGLRRNITVGLLPRIPELVARRRALYERLAQLPTAVPVTSRFIVSLLTPLAVYELLGHDPVSLYQEIIRRNRGRLEALNQHDFQADILNAALYTDAVRIMGGEGASFVSARTLIMAGDYRRLNAAECGVYALEEQGWIVLVWRQAKYAVLNRTAFRHLDEAAMKERAAKSSYVLDVGVEEHEAIRQALRLPEIRSASGYTVLDMAYLMSKTERDEREKRERLRRGDSPTPVGPATEVSTDFTL